MSLDLAMKLKLDSGDVSSKLKAVLELLKQMSKETSDATQQAQIEKTVKELDHLVDVLEVTEKVLSDTGKEAGKAGDEISELGKRANIENLQELAGTFQSISETLFNMTVGVVEAAATFEDLYAKMLTVNGGSKEMADEMMAWAERTAETTPFDLASVIDGTAKLEAYGLKAQEVFTKVGDLAAGYGKSLDSAVEAVADAQAGELERLKEFGITKQMLIQRAREEFSAEIVNSQNQITDLDSMNQALFAIMEERTSGAMGRMADTYHGAMNNFKDSVTKLQAALGEELLPILTDLIRELTKFIDFLNNLGSGFTGVISQALFFTTAIAGVSSGIIGAGLKLQSFVTQLQAAGVAAATSGTSFTSLSVSLTGMVPIVGALSIAFGTLANAYITAWRKMEEQKAEEIVEETKKIESGFSSLKDAIEIASETPLAIALDPNAEEKLKSIEERIIAIRELQLENIRLQAKLAGEAPTVKIQTVQTYQGPTLKEGVMGEEGTRLDSTRDKVMEVGEAYEYLTATLPEVRKAFEEIDIEKEPERWDNYRKAVFNLERELKDLILVLDGENKAHAENILQLEESEEVIEKSQQEYTQLTAKILEGSKAYKESVPAINEAKASLNDYLDELEKRNANKENLLLITSIKDIELKSEEELEQIYKDLGVSAEELEAFMSESATTTKKDVQGRIDALNQLVQAEEYTLDEKRKILSKMLQDETLAADARKKVYDEIENTEKERWDNFEEKQKTALAKGEITEKQYWANVKKYLDENEENLNDSQELKTELTRKYYEGIKKLGEKDVKDKEKQLKEKEKAFKDHLDRLKDLEEIGELSPEEKLKELQDVLKQEKITEDQGIAIKKEILATEKDIAEEKEKLQKEEQERAKANLQLQIETLQAEGQVFEAKKVKIQAEVDAKRQAGLDEVEIEKWKKAQLETIEDEMAEQDRQTDKELLALKKQHIQEEIEAVRNKAEQVASVTGNRVAAERTAHQQILALEEQLTDVIVAEYNDRIAEIHRQAKEMEKAGTDRVKTEEFVAESIKNLQAEIFNDFLEQENQKRAEIQETHDLIQDLEQQLAENQAKQQELFSGSGEASPLMSMEEAFAPGYKSPYLQKIEKLQKLKEEEKSLEEQKAAAFEKEQMQQTELKQIAEQKKAVQEGLNTELEKTTSHYGDIAQSSPWSSETAAVQQYTTAINEALAAMQDLNAESGDVGGSGGGSGGGGGAQFDPDDYSGQKEDINNQNTQGGQDTNNQSYEQTDGNINNDLIDAIEYWNNNPQVEDPQSTWEQMMQDYGEQYGLQEEAAGAVGDYYGAPEGTTYEGGQSYAPDAYPMKTSQVDNSQSSQTTKIENNYYINSERRDVNSRLDRNLQGVSIEVQADYLPAFDY